MQKSNKHPDETEDETLAAYLESCAEYIKYINKLELQRSVLNKIIEADFSIKNEINPTDTGVSESV